MFYGRNLPHWYPDVIAGFFLVMTWRLADSLPTNLVRDSERLNPRMPGEPLPLLIVVQTEPHPGCFGLTTHASRYW
jgi:hypothetical protein